MRQRRRPAVALAQAAMPRLVKTRREASKQERRNVDLGAAAKKRWAETVRAVRPKPPARGGEG